MLSFVLLFLALACFAVLLRVLLPFFYGIYVFAISPKTAKTKFAFAVYTMFWIGLFFCFAMAVSHFLNQSYKTSEIKHSIKCHSQAASAVITFALLEDGYSESEIWDFFKRQETVAGSLNSDFASIAKLALLVVRLTQDEREQLNNTSYREKIEFLESKCLSF